MNKILFLFFLAPIACLGQVQPMKETYLLLNSRYSAHVILDGDTIGTAMENKYTRFAAIPGDHIISVVAIDTALKWESRVSVRGGEQNIIDFVLTPFESAYGTPGTFTDPADQHVYKTTRIKKLEWFAENYALKTSNCRAPNDQSTNVPTMGYLYRYIDIVAPTGWRIPTEADYRLLMSSYLDKFQQLSADGISGFNINYPGYANAGGKEGFGNDLMLYSSTSFQNGRRSGVRTLFARRNSKYVDIARSTLVWNMRGMRDNQLYLSVRFVRDIK